MIQIEIDRIVFQNFAISDERADRIKNLVETELWKQFFRVDYSDRVQNCDLKHLKASLTDVNETQTDHAIADSLTQTIIRSITID